MQGGFTKMLSNAFLIVIAGRLNKYGATVMSCQVNKD